MIDFANDVFGRLITFEADAQPAFQALDACRAPGLLDHGTVSLLGVDRHDDLAANQRNADIGSADALRLREASDVAATVSTALADRWPVFDEALGTLRPCRPGDICILLPTRISLPSLEAELRGADLSYRAENSSVVYATTEVRQLLLAVRAADDPTDTLALVEALRSPMYGCSDVELWEWKSGGGTWNLWAEPPAELVGHPVAEAVAHVRSVAERVGTVSPADLLAAVADERRLFDLALADLDARDVWRRLRFVIEQARAWADAGGHGVRRYLQWATLQASESRVADTILPENDHDAVRVMTIHAAKGLEFPITIVAGLTTKPRRTVTNGVVWANDSWMLAGRGDDGVFVAHQPIDEQMGDAERRRLLYVACTRAVDHLVVSLHRGAPTKNNADYADWGPLTSAELLWAAGSAEPTLGSGARRGRAACGDGDTGRTAPRSSGPTTASGPPNGIGCSMPRRDVPVSPPHACRRSSPAAANALPSTIQASTNDRSTSNSRHGSEGATAPASVEPCMVYCSSAIWQQAPTSTISPGLSAPPRA